MFNEKGPPAPKFGVIDTPLPPGLTLDMFPPEWWKGSLYKTGKATFYVATPAETDTPPRAGTRKYMCSIWHKEVSISNEKVVIWHSQHESSDNNWGPS
jgi:hypothetical protein